MAIQRTWALGILGSNPTFPVRSLIIMHQILEFYYDLVHVQVSRNPQQWYYISNIVWPAGTYMVNRSSNPRGIHVALPGVNYGGEAGYPYVVPAEMHERGHNNGTGHSADQNDLMRTSVLKYGLPTRNDHNRWFAGTPFKPGRPKPWDAGERDRWKPVLGYTMAGDPLKGIPIYEEVEGYMTPMLKVVHGSSGVAETQLVMPDGSPLRCLSGAEAEAIQPFGDVNEDSIEVLHIDESDTPDFMTSVFGQGWDSY